MKRYVLSHLSDDVLLRGLATAVARERTATAEVLAHIAEVDARRLYLPAAYPSMFVYCVQELHLSEDAAFKRIKAARAARRFPAIFEAVAQGRLHLSAVVLLAPRLTEETAPDLLAAAIHKSKAEIEHLLAARFPEPDVPAWVEAIVPRPLAGGQDEQAPGPVGEFRAPLPETAGEVAAPAAGVEQDPGPVPAWPVPALCAPPGAADRSRVKPLAPQRYAVQFTMSQSAHDKLRYAQELLGHQLATGDIAQLFERALDALIPKLEQQKFSATSAPRRNHGRGSDDPRHIPADVRRAVWSATRGSARS